MSALLGFSSGGLEREVCVCCCVLEVVQCISSCFGGETDLKSEQNRGSGARGGAVPFFAGGGEITCSHLGALLERICSEHLFT